MANQTGWEKFCDLKKEILADVELYRTRCNGVRNELYQLLTFYSVFQGVVFSAVSTTAKLTCPTSVLPALLSLLATIGTVCGVHYKFSFFEVEKLKFIKQEQIAGDMKNRIENFEGNKEFDGTKEFINHEELREKYANEKSGIDVFTVL